MKQHRETCSFSKPPYLKLIGFRDLNQFNPVYTCGPPTFVTADIENGLVTTSLQGGFLIL